MSIQEFQIAVVPVKDQLFRMVYRMLGNVSDTEDVVQETLIKLWNGRHELNQVQNLEAWSMRIARNLAIDRLRARQRSAETPVEALPDQSAGYTPQDLTESTETFTHVKQLMDTLPEKQRLVMHLRDIEGLSYQEIADTLSMPMAQVKVYLFRARQSVREGLLKLYQQGITLQP